MYKYFAIQISSISDSTSSEKISEYRHLIIEEMIKMGATNQEISLLQTATIINSIRNNRKPEDVAWALLQ